MGGAGWAIKTRQNKHLIRTIHKLGKVREKDVASHHWRVNSEFKDISVSIPAIIGVEQWPPFSYHFFTEHHANSIERTKLAHLKYLIPAFMVLIHTIWCQRLQCFLGLHIIFKHCIVIKLHKVMLSHNVSMVDTLHSPRLTTCFSSFSHWQKGEEGSLMEAATAHKGYKLV